MAGVRRLEQVAVGTDRLRAPQQEEAGRLQGIVQEWHDLLLQRRLQVDEHVAATDEVDLGEGWVGQHVVPGEHAHVADRLADAVAAVHLGEETPQALRRDVLRDALRVEARAGLLDARSVEVGGEDLDRQAAALRLGELRAKDGEGVGFLAGRAPQYPGAQRLAPGAVLEQLGQHRGLEPLERLRVAEESRHRDEDVLVEGLHLRRVFAQKTHIVRHLLEPVQDHPAVDAAAEAARLVVGEVDARDLVHDLQDLAEVRLARGSRTLGPRRPGHVRVQRDAADLQGDLDRGEHEIHAAAGDGAARHAALLGRAVLGEGDPPLGLDLFQPEGAVGRRAGQDHADRPVSLVLRQGAEEAVDGPVLAAGLLPGNQLQAPPRDDHVAVGRDDVDAVRLYPRPIPDLRDRHRGAPGKDRRQLAGVRGRQVLHEHEGHAGIDRQRAQHLGEGLEPAGRGADADDGKGGARGLRTGFLPKSFRQGGGSRSGLAGWRCGRLPSCASHEGIMAAFTDMTASEIGLVSPSAALRTLFPP